MMKKSIRLGWIGCVCACLVAVLAVGCSLYANDRAFLSDAQYGVARQMYLQTGSLDLVKRQLQDMEWRRSSVNEAVYRLQKEFEVLPEEIPALAAEQAPATRAATPATSGTTSLTLPATPGAAGQPITLNPSAAAPAPTSATQTLPLPPPPSSSK